METVRKHEDVCCAGSNGDRDAPLCGYILIIKIELSVDCWHIFLYFRF